MKTRIVFIERKFWEFVSIEKIFEQIGEVLDKEKFEVSFCKLSFINNLTGILKNLALFRPPQADIYHITGHVHYIALVLPADNTILTVHDLGFLHNKKGMRRLILKKLFLDLPIRKLKYVTAISEATKQEIIKFTGCPEEKIRTIENPLRELFISDQEKVFNSENPNILQIGTSPHKNLSNVVKALRGISCRLKIVGRLSENQTRELKEAEINYQNFYHLDDTEIKNEYAGADIVVFCSTFEGFGMPVIEAQAMRTPVVTSNISPLKEVSGGGAFLADPYDFSSIREGINKIISDRCFREEIVKKGIENIERFRIEKVIHSYENLYQEVLDNNK